MIFGPNNKIKVKLHHTSSSSMSPVVFFLSIVSWFQPHTVRVFNHDSPATSIHFERFNSPRDGVRVEAELLGKEG